MTFKRTSAILFLFVLLLTNNFEIVLAEDNTDKIIETLQGLTDLSKANAEFIKPSDVKNISEFCQINGYRDRLESFKSFGPSTSSLGAWADGYYSVFETREISFLAMYGDPGFVGGPSITYLSDEARAQIWSKILSDLSANQGPLPRGAEFGEDAEQMSTDSGIIADQAEDLKAGAVQSAYICTDLSLQNVASCTAGLGLIQKISKPVKGTTMLPLWAEVMRDPAYMKVFRVLALKIVQNIKNKTATSTRFFDDLKEGFLDETKDPKKADEYTWKSMAIFASGGANTYRRPRFISGEIPVPMLEQVLYILGMGSIVLDRLTVQNGFLYTFPTAVNNICDYGKNYHFWMTAYLAREVMKSTKSLAGSAMAAFSAQKGYQFAKKDAGRDPSKPFTQNLYSNYNNNIRLDLSLAAAGAWFGAQSLEKVKSLTEDKINKGINLTFDGAKSVGTPKGITENGFNLDKPTDTVSFYSDWKKIINPDPVFRYFQKEMAK